jgi:hypothetical protein
MYPPRLYADAATSDQKAMMNVRNDGRERARRTPLTANVAATRTEPNGVVGWYAVGGVAIVLAWAEGLVSAGVVPNATEVPQ